MKTIHKYVLEITDEQSIMTDWNAKFLYVGEQNGSLCLWAEVDPTHETGKRHIRIVGTGHWIEPDLTYIGTVVINPFVWHVYEAHN